MTSDWIKMRTNLWNDPRVAQLCDLTGAPEAPVVGGLYWLWAAADEHTEDGVLPGLSLCSVSRKTGVDKLGEALAQIGWVEQADKGLRIIRFAEHNGNSAKRRFLDARRKAAVRKSGSPKAPAKPPKKTRPGKPAAGEAAGWDRFWAAYPKKQAKTKAAEAFARVNPDEALLERMLAAIQVQARSESWTKQKGEFIPMPATWLNGKRWEDEAAQVAAPARKWVG